MEAILAAAFGVDADADEYNKITEKAKAIFRAPVWLNFLLLIPFSYKFAKYIPYAFSASFDPIAKVARSIIQERKSGVVKRQVLLFTRALHGLVPLINMQKLHF